MFRRQKEISIMTKLLHIIASPRDVDSKSNALALAYIEAQRRADPDLTVDALDLWREPLPEFDGDQAAAKMTFFGVGEHRDCAPGLP